MDQLLRLVKTHRVTDGPAKRLRRPEQLFSLVEPDLRSAFFPILQHNGRRISKGKKRRDVELH